MRTFHPIQGKTVYIIFHSKGLGDTLAWFPYVEQFRIENKCKVKLFLPRQEMIPLLKPNYSDIEFLKESEYVEPFGNGELYFKLPFSGESVISYKIGCSWDGRQYIPLQQAATEVLGLPFIEKKPNLYSDSFNLNLQKIKISINNFVN